MFPDAWSYELFESSIPETLTRPDEPVYTTTDYENYYGRKIYLDDPNPTLSYKQLDDISWQSENGKLEIFPKWKIIFLVIIIRV